MGRIGSILNGAVVAAGMLSTGARGADAIPLEQLPEPVRSALSKRFPTAKLLEATREERNDYVYFFVNLRENTKDAAPSATKITVTEMGDITKVEPTKPAAQRKPD